MQKHLSNLIAKLSQIDWIQSAKAVQPILMFSQGECSSEQTEEQFVGMSIARKLKRLKRRFNSQLTWTKQDMFCSIQTKKY
jgi:hypothetical protein